MVLKLFVSLILIGFAAPPTHQRPLPPVQPNATVWTHKCSHKGNVAPNPNLAVLINGTMKPANNNADTPWEGHFKASKVKNGKLTGQVRFLTKAANAAPVKKGATTFTGDYPLGAKPWPTKKQGWVVESTIWTGAQFRNKVSTHKFSF